MLVPIPAWFYWPYISLEILFACITLTVSLYAFKVFILSGQRQSRLFAISFLFISISYAIGTLLDLNNINILSSLITILNNTLHITQDTFLKLGDYARASFYLIALLSLAYMTFKVDSIKIYFVMTALTLLGLVFSFSKMYLYYVFCSLLLAIILIHYIINYLYRKDMKTLMVLIAFSLLLISNLHFILDVNHQIAFMVGCGLGLVAYSLILLNLILVIKNAKKTQ